MDGLISLFGWYQAEITDKINSFDTSKEDLLAIVKHREQKLRDRFYYAEPPYPEELLIMLGYIYMDMQQDEEAKMYIELAIRYYPEGANAYNSMADYHQARNAIKNALKFVQKAS